MKTIIKYCAIVLIGAIVCYGLVVAADIIAPI